MNVWKRSIHESFSLKNRIMILFVACSLIPFAGIGLISYYTIDSMMTNKIQNGIQSNVRQVQLSLQNTINNLNHVSQQLSYQGTIGKRLYDYLESSQPYERSEIINDMKDEIVMITFSNPNIGIISYYFADDSKPMLENLALELDFDPTANPLLAQYYGMAYYGPHKSSNRVFHDQVVLSALRQVGLPGREDVYVYVESGFKLTQNILDADSIGKKSFYLVLDNDGRVAYSERPEAFPVDSTFPGASPSTASGNANGYYWFKGVSNQGWSVVSVIAESEYNAERNRWMIQSAFFFLIVLSVGLVLAWLLWKMVYRPLTNFHKEIKWAGRNDFRSESVRTNIPEFDYLLREFQDMKRQIGELIQEIEQKEKRRADLEIEKLRYQINPHFLMNTLDTAHWLAVLAGNNDIDRLVVSLNKLLYYNLGKTGEMTTVQEELDALREYVTLQQIRYDFVFRVDIEAEESVQAMAIPRFILQPIVENALYHGLDDDGVIQVRVARTDAIEIEVSDNGAGMTPETVERLLGHDPAERRKVGMGIGMNYVKRVLEGHYEGRASIDIRSEVGKGTSVLLRLPMTKEAASA